MDASVLLAKQGWRGAGHGLGSTGHGIARPLLISNKQDVLGVGKQKTQVADQWWMRAYDAGLKELGTGKQTALSSIREKGMNRGGLYGYFVKGEGMAGTILDSSGGTESSSNTSAPSDSSTPVTTPEVESTPEPKRSEKKRKHDGDKNDRRKKRKEEKVAQSKGKDKASKKKDGRSKQEPANEAKPTATEDTKLLRRAAKKALRQKRALKEAESRQASEDEEKRAESRKSKQSTDETAKPEKGNEKRKSAGKGMESQAQADVEDRSEKKLKKYAAKAAEKGITVEAYLAKKESKKEKAKK